MTALDEAYDRLADAWLENSNGFVNHGPMVCEALSTLGMDGEMAAWAKRNATPRRLREWRPGLAHRIGDQWQAALGQPDRLDDWITHFQQAISSEGWPITISTWVPRLLPAMGSMLFHGMIRTAHATRAISNADTQPRRDELARALAHWAARFGNGRRVTLPVTDPPSPLSAAPLEEVKGQLAAMATDAAHHFLYRPDAFALHAITGAMAIHLLSDHIPPAAAQRSVHQLFTAHRALLDKPAPRFTCASATGDRSTVATAAVGTGDEHAVKLTEAALRGFDATGDKVFLAAAESVGL